MSNTILLNAFSLNMVPAFPAVLCFEEISTEEARKLVACGFESAVGHTATAVIFSKVLGVLVPTNRTTVILKPGHNMLVGQYRGPRLFEGATELPPDATIQWLTVFLWHRTEKRSED